MKRNKSKLSLKVQSILKRVVSNSFFFPLLISPFLFLLYKVYLRKVSAFGCFDDCFNIVGGYFLAQGKTLYSEVFFNHQPLMAYLSFGIQSVTDPINIFALILAHRKFIFIFSILMNLLIAFRFRFAGIIFILFYEITKFYVFGDRFLAESIIVYPLVYLLGLVWYKFSNKNLFKAEIILAAFLTWFIVFLREPFILLGIFLFILVIFKKKLTRVNIVSIFIFLFLTIFFLVKLPFGDYFFNVFSINKNTVIGQGINISVLIDFLKIFFYPVYVLLSGELGYFRNILISLSVLFIIFSLILILKMKKGKAVGLIIFILGLANFRYVKPGHAFYEAFHMAPWYGMFIFSIALFVQSFFIKQFSRKRKYILIILLTALFIYTISPPYSFLWQKIDQHQEFINNYGNYLQYGEAARILASSKDTLFVDGFDELIHWQAKVPSPYRYSWYTSIMPYIPLYSKARLDMFKTNPPDIYYGSCPKEISQLRLFPQKVRKDYINLYSYGKPSCLYIKKTNVAKISKKQWERLKEFGFSLKPNNF